MRWDPYGYPCFPGSRDYPYSEPVRSGGMSESHIDDVLQEMRKQRDEAREAARWLYGWAQVYLDKDDLTYLEQFPWLEGEDTHAQSD